MEALEQKCVDRIAGMAPEFQDILSSLKDQVSKTVIDQSSFKMEIADRMNVLSSNLDASETRVRRDLLDQKASFDQQFSGIRERLGTELAGKEASQGTFASRLDDLDR